jgi:hypothetical protein
VLTDPRSETEPAAPLGEPNDSRRTPSGDRESRDGPDLEDGDEHPGSRVERFDLLSLLLLFTLAIEIGIASGNFVLAPLLTGVGGPRAQVRAVVLLVAAAITLLWRVRAAGAPHDPDELGSNSTDIPHAALGPGDRLARALANLDAALADQTLTATPLTVHVGLHVVEVFWDGPPPPPRPPWASTPSGWVWEADLNHLDPSSPRFRSPLPALVALGTTPTGSLWLNLAGFRVVALLGDAADVTAGSDAILTQLQRADAAGALDLLIVAGLPPSGGTIADVDAVTPERVLSALWRHRAAWRDPRARRHAGRARDTDATRPLVVAIGPDAPAPVVDPVLDAARGNRGVTCLVHGTAPGADLCLTLGSDQVHIPFLGDVPVRPGWGRGPKPDPAPPLDLPPGCPPTTSQHPEDSSPVQVRMLGRVAVEGAAGVLHAKSVELLAYLACHREGARDDQIRAALWPERALSPKTWANRVSVTRRAVGRGPDGEPLLRRFRDHVGQLAPSVRCDVDELDDALALASAATPAEQPEASRRLGAALALVRGRPFDVVAGYEWAFTELHVAHAERIVVDAAHRLGALALATGNTRGAQWAAEQGLRACPASELLHEDRMRACAAAGDRRGLDACRRDLLHAVEADDPTTALHPDTAAIFDQLRAALAGPPTSDTEATPPSTPRIDR